MDHSTAEQPAKGQNGAPVFTYHCLCKYLVLASTQPLSSLPVRSSTIEKPYILHLPDQLPSNEDSDVKDDDEPNGEEKSIESVKSHKKRRIQHFAVLFRTVVSPKAQIVRRSAGFEKRYLRCCARCKLPIGYQLDWCMFSDEETQKVTDEDGQQRKSTGRRMDYIYIFPGSLIDTRTMDETCQGGTPVGILRTKESTED